MTIIHTTAQLIEYKRQVESQKECLALSVIFSDKEREELDYIYTDLLEKINQKIANDIHVFSYSYL